MSANAPFNALPKGALDGRLRVLVVEDDPVQALLITLLLDRLNVSSNLVRNGAQAVEVVRTERHDLVLMDYLMPHVDGIEATRLIRQQELAAGSARVPIVAVTASAMADECRRYLSAGMDDVLLKPFTAQQLGAMLLRHAPPPDALPLCPPRRPRGWFTPMESPPVKLISTLAVAGSLFVATTATHAQVGVSIDIRQPGVYGRIDIGSAPPPPVVYAKPIIYAPPRVVVQQEPLYLYVPPGHQKNWGRHCKRYDAGGRPVYFVRETWVRERWDHEHGHDHGKGPKGHGPKGKGHDHGHRDDHGPGRGRD